jgi:hypothetical protein
MRLAIALAIVLAATPALAQPRLEVPVTNTATAVPVCFLFFCCLGPAPVVPDGAGGFVPFTNSRGVGIDVRTTQSPASRGASPRGRACANAYHRALVEL